MTTTISMVAKAGVATRRGRSYGMHSLGWEGRIKAMLLQAEDLVRGLRGKVVEEEELGRL